MISYYLYWLSSFLFLFNNTVSGHKILIILGNNDHSKLPKTRIFEEQYHFIVVWIKMVLVLLYKCHMLRKTGLSALKDRSLQMRKLSIFRDLTPNQMKVMYDAQNYICCFQQTLSSNQHTHCKQKKTKQNKLTN